MLNLAVTWTQGVRSLKKLPHLEPLLVFIAPPTVDDLKRRLSGRGTETDESMQSRLNIALKEIDYAKVGPPIGNHLHPAYIWAHLDWRL